MTAQCRLIGLFCPIGISCVPALSAARTEDRPSWDIAGMNGVIDQTNFIVDDKRSGAVAQNRHDGLAVSISPVMGLLSRHGFASVHDPRAKGPAACGAGKAVKTRTGVAP